VGARWKINEEHYPAEENRAQESLGAQKRNSELGKSRPSVAPWPKMEQRAHQEPRVGSENQKPKCTVKITRKTKTKFWRLCMTAERESFYGELKTGKSKWRPSKRLTPDVRGWQKQRRPTAKENRAAKIEQEKLCTLESQPGARTDACPKINGKTN
jgi:hypothetical protein